MTPETLALFGIIFLTFGADLTGHVDSTEAFQQAIEAAGSSRAVSVPIGTYKVQTYI